MALSASDIEWLNGKIRSEIEPLQRQLDEQAALADELGDHVWALNVLAGQLQKLIPPTQAWEMAQTLQAELDSVSAEQRSSRPAQQLSALIGGLLQRSCVPSQPT